MSFLVPLFLLGLAGVAVPVIVHLTRRQRRNVVAFPSLMFLERIPYQEQRRRRVQHWFLLLLRALALALLAFAFARPFLDRSDLVVGASGGPREVVVLLDRSYSMEIGDRMQRALDEASRVFDGLGPLDRASLVAFDQSASVLVRSTSDRARLRSALDSVSAGSGLTRFGPALKVAQTILEESEIPSGEVFLLSDFQRIGWSGDEGVRLPFGARIVPVPVGDEEGESPDNVQVSNVSLPRTVDTGRERVTPTARLVRRSGEEDRKITVTLEIDGQAVQTRSVSLGGDDATSVTFDPVTLSRPHTRGTVRVPSDDVPADDVRHFVVSPGSALSVRMVAPAVGQPDPNLYLSRALGISQDGRFDVSARRANSVAAGDVAGVDVLVLNDARLDGASAERVREYVEEGGSVLMATGERFSWPESARDLLPGAPGAPRDRDTGRGARLGFLDYDHPIFEVFAGPRSGDFGGARVFRARDVTVGDSAAVLARFDDGSVALAELRVGRGRVLLWATTLDAYWNDLALQPVFLPFVHRVVEYLAGRAEPTPSFLVGDVIDISNPAALESAGMVSGSAAGLAEGEEQVALTPSGAAVRLPPGDEGRYLPLVERGFYTIRPPGSNLDRPFVVAVNVDLEESDPRLIDPEDVVLAVEAGSATEQASSSDLGRAAALQREDQERRQSLWKWILAAALGLLMLETGLSNWVSRGKVTAVPGAGSPG